MKKYIYLDNAATTKASEEAKAAAMLYADELFYNPSASYAPALEVKRRITEAAQSLATLLGVTKDEIVFTSCATESNNYAFECGVKNKKGNIVVSAIEHASVYESAMRLKNKGFDVRFVYPDDSGCIRAEDVAHAADGNTAFVSVIHCSNETGAINDIAAISSAVKQISPKAVMHSDGVQAFCKIPTDMSKSGVDLYSVSAHKVGGLKGVGALYVRKGFNMQPFIVGGGQQNNRRSGTENVCGITGFAESAKAYKAHAATFDGHIFRNIFISALQGKADFRVNGSGKNSGYILSLSFEGLRGEVIAHMMEDRGVLIGLGSACSSHIRTNRVLDAMGVERAYADGSIRISFSPQTTEDEVRYAADALVACVLELKEKIQG